MSLSLLGEVILPATFTKEDTTFIGYDLDSKSAGQDQFQAVIVFLTAILKRNGETDKVPLVVKFRPSSIVLKTEFKTDFQFYNEVLVYSKLLPLLDRLHNCEDIFPKFYYGVSSIVDSTIDVAVIEDLRPSGFGLSREKWFLDYHHLKIALEKLGKFHSLSYKAKKDSPDDFFTLVQKLKETFWNKDAERVMAVSKACLHRALDPLISRGINQVEELKKLLCRVDEDIVGFFRELVAPEEPNAVLCHGDFLRNNMLFKYNQGTPTDVRFFDLATARYSSPAVDIALLMFLNSSREVRTAHLDDLLACYYRGLSSAGPGIPLPSLEDIYQELRKKTLHAFLHISYFLPMVLYETDINMEKIMDNPPEEVARSRSTVGGEIATRVLTDLAEELLEKGFLSFHG